MYIKFVEDPQNKIISDETKERIRKSLLERVSLEGICRIFDVSMPWLLEFMEKTFQSLQDDLNATVIAENDDFEGDFWYGIKILDEKEFNYD